MIDKELLNKLKEDQAASPSKNWSVEEKLDMQECILNGITWQVIVQNNVFPNRDANTVQLQHYRLNAKIKQGARLSKEGTWIQK